MSHLTPDQVLATPAGDLAERSSDSLFQLKNDAADLLAAAKAIVEHVDRALDLRYAQRAHQLRLAAGKDTGVVHFDDGLVRITADLPKKVEWDQAKLNDITRRITANGEDPAEYVEISYRIPKEGAVMFFDQLAIPKDAKHPKNAHLFIDYLLRPEVAAKNSSYISYANANAASTALIDKSVTDNPNVYPPADLMTKLVPDMPESAEFSRSLNRAWTSIKTGK